MIEMLRLCVLGWQGVLNGNDEEVPFDANLIDVEIFPEGVLVLLENAITSAFGNREEEEKN